MSSHAVRAPALRRAAGWIDTAHERLLAVRTLYVLSTLVALQWAALAALAVTVRHNGWIYYMGGDQLWHYSSAYLLAHGKLAPTFVGYGWATILAPITWFAGPNLVNALPTIVLLNAIVLLPIALLAIYGIGCRLGGRIFGYWAALLWVVLPYAGIAYTLNGYHQKYTELTLPQVLGLGAMSDFPSVVVLLVGAYLCLRALDEPRWQWAAAAGAAVGYSLAIKPSNTAFVIAPLLLFAIYKRRALLPAALGALPPLLLLAFWKVRGYGHLPVLSRAEPARRVALGSGGVFGPLHKYTGDNSWTQLQNNLIQLREFFWSDRLLEFVVVAGLIALTLRSRRGGIFVGTWFFAFLLLKGTYLNSRVEDATFWRLMLPAFPAFVLLVAAVPLAWPGVRLRPTAPHFRVPRSAVLAATA
ncbi:MAG: glycosyltransferase family 39 protein, partial [Actinobacteria bacterium]